MASTSHANVFRPVNLADVLGQARHMKSLAFFLKNNKLPPVILISGKSGVGKTTVARVVAAAAMCATFNPETVTACGTCVNCRSAAGINDGPNFMHLDGGGSNLKDVVENDLKQFLYSAPVRARYKVCIADEAQALSIGAKNSLLTLAENLPKNALIIMTTTDPEAIDSAILTRALKYHFAPLTSDQMIEGVVRHRKSLNNPESREALSTLAGFAEGSMREFWQLIQQWESYEESLTPDLAAEIVGGAKAKDRGLLWQAIAGGDFGAIQRSWKTMVSAGANPQRLGSQLMNDLYRMSAENPLQRDWPMAIRLLSQAQVYKEELGYTSALMSIAKTPAEQVASLTVEDLTERLLSRILPEVEDHLDSFREVIAALPLAETVRTEQQVWSAEPLVLTGPTKEESLAECQRLCDEALTRLEPIEQEKASKTREAKVKSNDKFAEAMERDLTVIPKEELKIETVEPQTEIFGDEDLPWNQTEPEAPKVVDVDEMELPSGEPEVKAAETEPNALGSVDDDGELPWEHVVLNLDEPEAVYKYVFSADD